MDFSKERSASRYASASPQNDMPAAGSSCAMAKTSCGKSASGSSCAAYDDTSIQMVMDMLAGYTVPDSRQRQYQELKEAFERIDWEKMSALTTPDVNV